MRRTRGFLLIAGLVCVMAPTGCREDGQRNEKTTVALIMKARTNPFFEKMADGARDAADQAEVNLIILSVDKETDFDKQAGFVENVVAQGVDAILVAPADSKAIVAPLLEAQKHNIPIINLDNRIDPETARRLGLDVLAFIGPDNEQGAGKAGRYLIERINGRGQVVMIEGIRGVDNAEARKRGFRKAVEATDGKVTVVASESAEWHTEPAQRKMEGILTRYPNLAGVFCANDMMALGAVAAIAAAGRQGEIIVTAYDNLDAARQAIKAGRMHATVEQHPYKMGQMGVRAALGLIAGQTVPAEIRIETELVTAETIQ